MKNLLILTDWKNYFSSKFIGDITLHRKVNIEIEIIADYLRRFFHVELHHYHELDLTKNYKGWFVIYASSEERGLFYKGFIEDVLLKLVYDGAFLIPDFRYFRAHGNKVFQEIIRKQFKDEDLKNINSDIAGRLDELQSDKYKYPVVLKQSSGSGSIGVRLAKNRAELKRIAAQLSYVRYNDQFYTRYKDIVYSKLGWKLKTVLYNFLKRSQRMENPRGFFNTNKFIVQNYIPDLDSDYKVLYYYGKYYVLHRMNRDNDFRASGSGKFSFPEDVVGIKQILDFARKVKNEIITPMISMDIGYCTGGRCYLIEFQCIGFGAYTIQYAEWHFEENDIGEWYRVDGKDNIEMETARAINAFIKERYG